MNPVWRKVDSQTVEVRSDSLQLLGRIKWVNDRWYFTNTTASDIYFHPEMLRTIADEIDEMNEQGIKP